MEMKDSWLVQRLEKPWQMKIGGIMADNPFSFGGGLRNGGLTPEAMNLIREIFSFDYMGAAEFEFGAVPQALNAIAKVAFAGDLETYSVTFPLSQVEEPWGMASPKKGKKAEKPASPEGNAEVFVIAQKGCREEIAKRIKGWASGKGPRLKEGTLLNWALRPREDHHRKRCGWLELNNGFFFFTDRDMFKKTATLFGVEVKD